MAKAAQSQVVRKVNSAVRAALLGPCRLAAAGPPVRVLVGVSGGPDSLCLLHALHRVGGQPSGRRTGPRLELAVAYFDHQLREPEAVARERAFVARQAEALGLPFVTGGTDVRAVARNRRLSLEDAARRCRYAFLQEAAGGLGANAVAVGHTATDQAETVVLRMLRGTGIAGLGAMRWRAPWPLGGDGPALFRPLLGIERRQTESYCAALGLEPRRDPENDNPRYLRNRVRQQVLPLLTRLNPSVVRALGDLATSAQDASTLVGQLADVAWTEVAQTATGRIVLRGERLRTFPRAVEAEVLRRGVLRLTGSDVSLRHIHVTALQQLLAGRGRVIHLPAGVRGEMLGGDLVIECGGPAKSVRGSLVGEWPLVLGHTRVPGWRVRVERMARACIRSDRPLEAWLRPEVFAEEVSVTGRRPGDRIQPLGMVGTKKVQDLLVDAHMPRAERDAVPIVRAGGQLVWVVGVRLAGWAAARGGEVAVRIRFQREVD